MPKARSIALAALALIAVAACKKKEDPAPAQSAAPAPPPPPQPKPAPVAQQFDVPFKGTYSRTAKVTYKNNQRIRLVNAAGTATMTIEAGKVTYVQSYPDGNRTAHVTETYSFNKADIRPVTGGYDVPLVFQKMDTDAKNYWPDSKDPKIEARKQGPGWEIGFTYRDTNGITGGIEFR